MPAFSVLTEPWIPAVGKDGTLREYGILALLEHAHSLESISDPAPPLQFGLYRLLVAFLMDAYELKSMDDLADLLAAERFDMAVVERYIQRWGSERFDLFDPTTPFLQTPAPDAEQEPVAKLLPHLPTGSNVIHFHHCRESDHAFSPAVCAKTLASLPPFMMSGGRGYSPSINGAPPWYILIRGANLFETLLLNCYTGDMPALSGDEGPAWRATKPLEAKKDAVADSLLEGLTWRSRTVCLIPGEGGICTYSGTESPVLVRRMHWGYGFSFVGQDTWTDPNVAYLYLAKGRFPLRAKEEKEIWRDTGPLLLLRKDQFGKGDDKGTVDRPWVVNQFRRLRDDYGLLPGRRMESIEVYGLRTDGKAKVFEWQCERLDLPTGVARNPQAPSQVRTALDLADDVAGYLEHGVTTAYPRQGKGKQKVFARLIASAQREYWLDLETAFREELLESLAVQDPDDDSARESLSTQWRQTLCNVATRHFEEALDPLDADAKSLRRQAEARSAFRSRLSWIKTPPAERQKREGRKANHGG